MDRGGHRTVLRARDFSCYAQDRTTAPTGFGPVRKDGAHHRAGLQGRNGARTGVPPGIPGGAMCVQRFDDSLNSAIHITYRISLRSSSLPEPRDPLLKVLTICFLLQAASLFRVEFRQAASSKGGQPYAERRERRTGWG
jgi:hypothetical protein